MLLILTKSRVGDFWNLVRKWFKRQFDAVAASIDFTPVEEKLDEVKEAVDNIHVDSESADQLAQFFGLPEALPQYTYATDQEVIDIVDDVYNDYFPND